MRFINRKFGCLALLGLLFLAACTPAEELPFRGTMSFSISGTATLFGEIQTPASKDPSVRLQWTDAVALLACAPVAADGTLTCGDAETSLVIISDELYRSHFEGIYDGNSWMGSFTLEKLIDDEADPSDDASWVPYDSGSFSLVRRSDS